MRRATAYSNSCSQVVLIYFHPLRCNSLLKCVLQPKIAENHKKTLFYGFKVVDLDGNRKGVWDFLLVINSNLDPISHCF